MQNNWTERTLDEIAYYYNGMAFKPSDWRSEGVKIIRIEQLNNPEGDYDFYQGPYPESNAIDNGDLIFSWSATLKVVVWKHGHSVLNQHLFKVVPKVGYDLYFIYHLLDFNMEKLGGSSQGSTMKHVKRSDLKGFKVNVPLREAEQRSIADILKRIDSQIEQTAVVIAKYRQMKVGMMHDLFTRGIDPATGQLRPSSQEAPVLYKESSLGMIPKEWGVEKIGDITSKVGSGVTPRGGSNVYKLEGVLFIRSQNVHHEGLLLGDVAYISPKVHEAMASSTVHPNDVLLNITGASIGRCTYFPTELSEANVNQHVCIIRLANPSHSKAHYFSSLISSHFGQNQIYRLNAGGNREGLNYQQVRAMQFAVCKEDEMTLISQTLLKTENMIKAEIDLLGKLSQLKKGLMSDLLSGKVKVKLRYDTIPEEVM